MRKRHAKKLLRKETQEVESRNARAAAWHCLVLDAFGRTVTHFEAALRDKANHRPPEEVFCHRNKLMTL